MLNKSLQQFDRLYPKFKVRQHQIPDNLRWKLLYIADKINKSNLKPVELTLAQQQETQELQGLDRSTLAIIFNFLVKSLLLEKKTPERQCKVKYPGVFQLWKNCRLSTESKYIIVTNQKTMHKYELSLIDISNCRRSKNSFDLYFKSQLLLQVKFATNFVFNEFLTHLECAIEQVKEGRPQGPLARLQQKYQQEKEKEPNRMSTSQALIKEIQRAEVEEKAAEVVDEKPKGYQIVEENENLLICQKQGEPRMYVSLSMASQSPLQKVVNFYIQQKEWNGFINTEEIKQDEDDGFIQIYRGFKKESIIESEKAVYVGLKVVCTKNSASLIQESIQNDPQGKDQKIPCTIKTITKFYRCLGGTKIIIDSELKVKGYSNHKYAISILTKLYSDLKFFENSFKISQLQKNKLRNIVTASVERTSSKFGRQSSRILEEKRQEADEFTGKKDSELPNTNDTLQLQPMQNYDENDCQFLKLKPSSPLAIPSSQYLQLVQNNQHQRYYLQYRFSQNILPKYQTYTPPYAISELFKKGTEYKVSENNELIFINYDVLNGQKDSLKFIIKQIGANIITGKSVLNVSMPVDIFESRSLLERSACSFGSAPDYLLPVADADPFTQIKNVLTLFSTIPTLELIMLKPFNPILGETFQASIKGIPIYYEQISHHPPISSFYMTCPEFTMHGRLAAFADISINSAVGGNEGVTHIIFRNGSHFQCYFPPCEISGLIFGDRSFRAYGRGYILEKKSLLFAQMSIQKQKKGLYERGDEELTPATLLGGIFKVTPEFMEEVSSQSSLRKFSGITKKDVTSKLGDIRGIWFQDIKVNGEVINKNIKVYPLEYPKVALPSDSNYRADILYHKVNDQPESQKMKEVLEVKQRSDRKLREKYAKLSKKRS